MVKPRASPLPPLARLQPMTPTPTKNQRDVRSPSQPTSGESSMDETMKAVVSLASAPFGRGETQSITLSPRLPVLPCRGGTSRPTVDVPHALATAPIFPCRHRRADSRRPVGHMLWPARPRTRRVAVEGLGHPLP